MADDIVFTLRTLRPVSRRRSRSRDRGLSERLIGRVGFVFVLAILILGSGHS